MPLVALAGACRDETEKYRRRESFCEDFCFELFRRAVCERDQLAWDAVITQYRGMVLAWVERHPAAASTGEDDDYWVNRTFERFWRAIGPERLALFPNVPSLLHYLKMCAHSALLDEVRSREAALVESLPDDRSAGPDAPDVEVIAMGAASRRELWEAIRRELHDDSERLVVHLSFALGLKPQEVRDRYPDRFPTVAEVYRVKRNVLDRLRRSPEIQEFLS